MSLDVRIRQTVPGFTLDVDFSAPPGVTALFGRSGAGKTSVVDAVAGLRRPQAGRIVVDGTVLFDSSAGVDVPRHRRRVGYVFQEGRLFPHLNVRRNLLFGQRFGGESAVSFDHVVGMLGIGGLLARRPAGLSGGEKQRVAIGRALLSGARVLLMDEPLASLDEARKAEILPYLQRLKAEAGMPILYVSHALPEIAQLATTLVVMQDGRVLRSGPASEMLSDPAAMPMLGARNAGAVLRTEVLGPGPDGLSRLGFAGGELLVPEVEAVPGARLMVRIAARDVLIANTRPQGLAALNVLPATVLEIRGGEGPGAAVRLSVGGEVILARTTRASVAALSLAEGDACWAVLKATAVAREDIAPEG
ncbi:molybdenum ABC transporter ATP-binding protein [Algicella marina]|uniref:Molybdenum ABC transporter ATP-binding protein n=1 Tax=Algicella marina TaxID=2683284 RepID=A0A6P1T500_9RHOB|nr:molybdenum ABC transporter ATP-binding protein [Algicella marina]QHQ36773.1 molybdenum ABC transporter ATP-binding protein [Algicella marina]